MKEKEVVEILKAWLKCNDWVVTRANHKGPGVDIVAEKNGKRWFIETKGDAKNDDPANQDAAFYSALGQLVAYRSEGNAKYSVAFPQTHRYKSRWKGLSPAARCSVDSCLFVTNGKLVEELSWCWP